MIIPTRTQFSEMIPSNREADEWYPIAIDMFKKYDINTVNRIAGFMAQTAHESMDYRVLEENLNYSVSALNRVFSRYFGPGKRNANEYARNPEKLANYVYMDKYRSSRGALGNVREGDGWKFRGGGIKQLTGRNNYEAFGRSIDLSADEAADYVRTKQGAFESACWFWDRNNLERYADNDDINGMSVVINGGKIGLEDRRKRYFEAKNIMSTGVQESSDVPQEVWIQRGSRGDIVKKIQTALGLVADGIFGPNTEAMVKSWQRKNRYEPNGIVTADQLGKLINI